MQCNIYNLIYFTYYLLSVYNAIFLCLNFVTNSIFFMFHVRRLSIEIIVIKCIFPTTIRWNRTKKTCGQDEKIKVKSKYSQKCKIHDLFYYLIRRKIWQMKHFYFPMIDAWCIYQFSENRVQHGCCLILILRWPLDM